MIDEYAALKAAIESAGYFTTFQPIDEPGDRLVCASDGGDWGLGGLSFWIAVRNDRWFFATWVPRIYEVPNADDVSQLAVHVLRTNNRKGYDLDAEIKEQFSLIEVSDDQFDQA